MIGELEAEENEKEFIQRVKNTFNTGCVRHYKLLNKPVKKVAVLGGSGAFAIDNAKSAGADVYISADFKYHDLLNNIF